MNNSNLNDESITWLTQLPSSGFVKPTHSYIGLIAQAILAAPERRLLLSELYEWILVRYPYFRFKGNGWRNSIRHNLSLNDCFIKAGRAPNGKSSYWTIHPANLEDFIRGDFRRKQAQWKVKSHDVRAFAGRLNSYQMWSMEIQQNPISYPDLVPILIPQKFNDPTTPLQKKQKFDVESLLQK